jgi:hypothetical protein
MTVVDTRLRLGDTMLVLGPPDEYSVITYDDQSQRTFRLSAWYLNSRTVISTGGLCPMNKYNLRVPLVYYSNLQRVEPFATRRLAC